jgi:hypothetical protein
LYTEEDKEPQGPFNIQDLDIKFRLGQIKSNALAWKEGMEDWKQLNDIQEIKEVL